jgi:aspartyl protease family protein
VNDGTAISAVYGVLAIVLVGSSLVAMRLPLGKAVKMALAWVAIFGIAFALFTFRSEFKALGNRLYASAMGDPVALAGGEMRIEMAEDGHFWVRGKVNGTNVRFLVDSGASTTTLSAETAAAARVQPSGERRIVNTANGRIVVARATAARLTIGTIERSGFAVDVTSRDSTDILGMNFLSSLDGWRVEKGELVLQP